MSLQKSLNFLLDLRDNNHKDWFNTNRNYYLEAKAEFTALVEELLIGISQKRSAYAKLEASECIFRINRDLRFTANKAPYKTNFGASVNLYGKKSPKAGLYIHIEPNASFIGGGVYKPPPDILSKIRQEIDYNYEEFKALIENKNFKRYYNSIDITSTLKKTPKGYDAGHPGIVYLKLRSLIAICPLKNQDIKSTFFAKDAVKRWIALFPFIDFLNRNLND